MTSRIVRQLGVIAVMFLLLIAPIEVHAQATPEASPQNSGDSLQAAVDWLLSQQGTDGAWLGFSGTPDVGVTIDAVLALAAARNAGIEVDLSQAITFLDETIAEDAQTSAGAGAKAELFTLAAGEDPENFGGMNPWDEMLDETFDSSTDLYGTGVYDTALVLLAYGARGEEPPGIVLDKVEALQLPDGAWAFDGNTLEGSGDTNTTSIMIQALVALGMSDSDMVLHGVEYLQRTQLPQGFPFQLGPGATPDANSTGVVIQALIAAGEDPSSQAWQNVLGSLAAFQNPDGAFSYQLEPLEPNLFATLQAIPALAGQPLPIVAGESDAPAPAPTCATDEVNATPVDGDEDMPCAA